MTWHHFDPPWHVKQHHDPKGMIALCDPHHRAADRGVFSTAELQELKTASPNIPAHGEMPWAKKQFLVRLAGNYLGGTHIPLMVDGIPVIKLSKNDDGLFLLSFTLQDGTGTVIAEMHENIVTIAPNAVNDVEVAASGTSLKFWMAKRDIGLDLSFSRLTLEELNQRLKQDWEQSRGRLLSEMPELADYIGDVDSVVGPNVLDWAVKNCVDDENRVPFLDFDRLKVNTARRRIDLKHSIATCHYCASLGDNVGFSLVTGI